MKECCYSIRNVILFSLPWIKYSGIRKYLGSEICANILVPPDTSLIITSKVDKTIFPLCCQHRFVIFHQRQWNLLNQIFYRTVSEQTWGLIYCIITLLISWNGAKLRGSSGCCICECLASVTCKFIVLIKRISLISLQATVQTSHCQ